MNRAIRLGALILGVPFMALAAAPALAVPTPLPVFDPTGFTAFTYTGLAFNKREQDHDEAPASNDPQSTTYTMTHYSGKDLGGGANETQNSANALQILRDSVDPNDNLGQFNYVLYVPDANVILDAGNPVGWVPGGLAGGHLSFSLGSDMIMDGNCTGGSSNCQPDGLLRFTGGELDILTLAEVDAILNGNWRQDLPFNFGQNILDEFYIIDGRMAFEYDIDGIRYVGTIEVNGENTDGANPTKNSDGTYDRLLDPRDGGNSILNDLAFFFEGISDDFDCYDISGVAPVLIDCQAPNLATQNPNDFIAQYFNHIDSGNSQNPDYRERFALNIAGWGGPEGTVIETPEPATVGLLGAGLLGLGMLRRRRARAA